MLPPAMIKGLAMMGRPVGEIAREEAEADRDAGQPWIAAYTAGHEPIPAHLAAWLRAQSPAYREALARFPSGCLVVRDGPADAPLPLGDVPCILMSVRADDHGSATFRQHPGAAAVVSGPVAGLRVVGYYHGQDGDAVRASLEQTP